MISPDERIKELKKQGYISGVMAGKRIRERSKLFRTYAPITGTSFINT